MFFTCCNSFHCSLNQKNTSLNRHQICFGVQPERLIYPQKPLPDIFAREQNQDNNLSLPTMPDSEYASFRAFSERINSSLKIRKKPRHHHHCAVHRPPIACPTHHYCKRHQQPTISRKYMMLPHSSLQARNPTVAVNQKQDAFQPLSPHTISTVLPSGSKASPPNLLCSKQGAKLNHKNKLLG
jgi:hypothetical protein